MTSAFSHKNGDYGQLMGEKLMISVPLADHFLYIMIRKCRITENDNNVMHSEKCKKKKNK